MLRVMIAQQLHDDGLQPRLPRLHVGDTQTFRRDRAQWRNERLSRGSGQHQRLAAVLQLRTRREELPRDFRDGRVEAQAHRPLAVAGEERLRVLDDE